MGVMTWWLQETFPLPAGVMALGVLLGVWGCASEPEDVVLPEAPQVLTCRALATNGPGENPWVTLTSYAYLEESFAVQRRQGASEHFWDRSWVPALPADHPWFKRDTPAPEGTPLPTDWRVLVSRGAGSDLSLSGLNLTDDGKPISGMVSLGPDGLERGVADVLRSIYPGIDLNRVYVFDRGSKPRAPRSGSGTGPAGILLFVLGGAWLGYQLHLRRNAPSGEDAVPGWLHRKRIRERREQPARRGQGHDAAPQERSVGAPTGRSVAAPAAAPASVQFECPACHNAFSAPTRSTQRLASCPHCGTTVTLGGEPETRSAGAPTRGARGTTLTRTCRGCGHPSPASELRCLQCGMNFRQESEARELGRGGIPFEERGLNAGVIGGIALIAIAVAWFVAGWHAGRIFFYPPILALIGIGAIVKGIAGPSGSDRGGRSGRGRR
jgi:hypothetical protein